MGWDWTALRALALSEARAVLRDDRAQDAAQEATLRAWRHAAQCRTPERPGPWVRAIARREALRVAAGERALDELLPNEATVDALHEQVHVRIDVHRAVAELSSSERIALAACYWLGLTDRQLAAHLGIPVGTAKVRLHRTRMRLRSVLAEQAAPISVIEH